MKKHIKSLMTGNGIAQVLQLSAMVVFAKIYTPEDFGILGKVQAIATIVVAFITLQTHLLLSLSSSRNEANKRLLVVHIIVIILYSILFVPAYFIGDILPLTLALILGIINSFASYYVYEGNFSKLSFYYIIRAFLMITFQAIFAFFEIKNGLLYGAIFGEFFSAVYLAYSIMYKKIKIQYLYTLKNISIIKYIIENNSFTLYGVLQELISVANFSLPLLLFINFFGENIGGQFAMANRLVWAPTILITSSLAQVFYHNFTQKNQWEILNKWIWLSYKYIAIMVAIPILYYYFSDIMIYVLGTKWQVAKEMIFYLLFSGIFFIYAIPYRVAFRATEKLKYLMLLDFVILLSIFSVFAFFSLNAINTIVLLTLCNFTQSISTILLMKYILTRKCHVSNY